jgi:hypothetical protein
VDRYTQAVRALEAVLRQEPRWRKARATLANALAARALAYLALKRDAEAANDWERALQLTLPLEQEKGWFDYRDLCQKAVSLARAGAHALAAAGAQALATRTGMGKDDLYQVAAAWALCVPAVRNDTKLATAEQEQLAGQYATQAVALLRELQRQGYFEEPHRAEALKTDEDLRPLRDRADFQKLLLEMESGKQK